MPLFADVRSCTVELLGGRDWHHDEWNQRGNAGEGLLLLLPVVLGMTVLAVASLEFETAHLGECQVCHFIFLSFSTKFIT